MEKTLATTMAELIVAKATHEGMVGKNNEDALEALQIRIGNRTLHLGIVADGVGGQTAGEMASNLAVSTIKSHFQNLKHISSETVLSEMQAAIDAANRIVHERAHQDSELDGMATTVVMAAVMDGHLYTSHVGDSRVYIMRHGKLIQLSKDHSWVQEAVEAGLLTSEQARVHPNRNVIRRSLGSLPEMPVDQEMQSPHGDIYAQGLPLKRTDMILLCSDGLTDMINDEAVLASLQDHPNDLSRASDELIRKANEAGGKDNISVILMQYGKSETDGDVTATASGVSPVDQTAKMPKVVPVPLNKQEKATRARTRRMRAIVFIFLLLGIAFVLAVVFNWIPLIS